MKSNLPFLLMILCLFTTACGQPGPLYLPSEEGTTVSGKKPKPEQSQPKSEEPKIETQTDQYDPF